MPYRLPELLEAIALEHRVFIVEGEKDVETLAALGITATCNPGAPANGAQNSPNILSAPT